MHLKERGKRQYWNYWDIEKLISQLSPVKRMGNDVVTFMDGLDPGLDPIMKTETIITAPQKTKSMTTVSDINYNQNFEYINLI